MWFSTANAPKTKCSFGMDLKICHVLITLEGNSATLYNCNHHATRSENLKYWIFFKQAKKLLKILYDKYE